MADKGVPVDARVAAIAARQHGVVSAGQLRGAGLSRDAIAHRVRRGRLHRLHRGVYAVGTPALTWRGRWKAAVLAAGEGAILSHRSAAALWDLIEPASGPVEITLPGRGGRRKQAGIRIRRSTSLLPTDRTRHLGIEATTPARTIADLRHVLEPRMLRQATRQAEFLGLPLGEAIETDRTRSELETMFLSLCHRHGLPPPQVNVRVGPYLVDFLWPAEALIVETDGYRYHRWRAAFEDDRERDLELRALGYEVIRLSYRQVVGTPERIAATLRELLARAQSSGHARSKRPASS